MQKVLADFSIIIMSPVKAMMTCCKVCVGEYVYLSIVLRRPVLQCQCKSLTADAHMHNSVTNSVRVYTIRTSYKASHALGLV